MIQKMLLCEDEELRLRYKKKFKIGRIELPSIGIQDMGII